MASQVSANTQPDVQQEQLVAWVAGEYDYVRPKRREIREATVLAVQEDRVLVDLGTKRDGRVPGADLERLDDEIRDSLQVGAQVPVYVLDPADDRDEIIVWSDSHLRVPSRPAGCVRGAAGIFCPGACAENRPAAAPNRAEPASLGPGTGITLGSSRLVTDSGRRLAQ